MSLIYNVPEEFDYVAGSQPGSGVPGVGVLREHAAGTPETANLGDFTYTHRSLRPVAPIVTTTTLAGATTTTAAPTTTTTRPSPAAPAAPTSTSTTVGATRQATTTTAAPTASTTAAEAAGAGATATTVRATTTTTSGEVRGDPRDRRVRPGARLAGPAPAGCRLHRDRAQPGPLRRPRRDRTGPPDPFPARPRPVHFQKLTSTDGFIAFDLGDAPAVGVVRLAPKVLRDGAELLARSTTYAAASFGLSVGGGSAGLNAKPDVREATIAAFLEEAAELVGSGRWIVGAGVGLRPEELDSLPGGAARAAAFDPLATGESAVAAALGALGSLDGKQLGIVGGGPVADAAAASAGANGATAIADASFDTACDALLVAGKAGVLEHDLAATVHAGVVVPLSPVPVTARALAILGRAGVVVVPDFLSTVGPLLAAVDADGGDPMERVHSAVAALAGEGTNLWMAAVTKAEEHLRSWQDPLPFGRPLA